MERDWTKQELCWRALETVISLAVVVLALLQLTEVWDGALDVAMPLMGVKLLLEARREWKQRRDIAMVSLFTALFVLGCGIAVWLL